MNENKQDTYEANRMIEETLEDGSLHHKLGTALNPTDANIQLQEAFYDNKNQSSDIPLYINNNTPAIKIK